MYTTFLITLFIEQFKSWNGQIYNKIITKYTYDIS